MWVLENEKNHLNYLLKFNLMPKVQVFQFLLLFEVRIRNWDYEKIIICLITLEEILFHFFL